jgi:hypothetical protein
VVTATVLPSPSRSARDELVEITLLTTRSSILDEQREIVLVEAPEPFVPRDWLQALTAAVAGKIETNHAGIARATGALHARGPRSALFSPAANLVVLG